MNTLEKLKKLKEGKGAYENLTSFGMIYTLLDILIDGLSITGEKWEKVKEPEIRPQIGEVWIINVNKYPHIICDKNLPNAAFHPLIGYCSKSDEMIHNQNGWKLIWSPDPQRMKLIQGEKK